MGATEKKQAMLLAHPADWAVMGGMCDLPFRDYLYDQQGIPGLSWDATVPFIDSENQFIHQSYIRASWAGELGHSNECMCALCCEAHGHPLVFGCNRAVQFDSHGRLVQRQRPRRHVCRCMCGHRRSTHAFEAFDGTGGPERASLEGGGSACIASPSHTPSIDHQFDFEYMHPFLPLDCPDRACDVPFQRDVGECAAGCCQGTHARVCFVDLSRASGGNR